ncbi:MAG TPA: hypothetical protein VE617_15155 [Propionibacteriaceae bacterium]|nr:hypothetical protein [Propionibacteriaceae bacterium]
MTNANVWGMAKKPKRISNALYEADLLRLQTELVTLQEWTRPPAPGSC